MSGKSIDYCNPKWFHDTGIVIDIDPDLPYRYLKDISSYEAAHRNFDDYFRALLTDTNVTDVLICAFQQTSYVPTNVMNCIWEKIVKNTEAGIPYPADKAPFYFEKSPLIYKAWKELGFDWMEASLECCRNRGARPWVYLRMNDLHFVDIEHPLQDSFKKIAREKGYLIGGDYGQPRSTSGSIRNLYNFKHLEVRQWLLTYIEEILMRYDMFGLHLDFMRNIYCFDYLHDEGYAEIMTDFIREIRALTKKAEAVHGHPIKLMARLGTSLEHNLVFGFDVATWAKEGLVDALIPCPEAFLDSGIAVDRWKAAVGEDIAIFPGTDYMIIEWSSASLEHNKGAFAAYYSLGADGMYFENRYVFSGEDAPFAQYTSLQTNPIWFLDKENVCTGHRIFRVTQEHTVPIGETPYKPLPISLQNAGSEGATLPIAVGPILETDTVYLNLGFAGRAYPCELPRVTVNGISPVEVMATDERGQNGPGCYYVDSGFALYWINTESEDYHDWERLSSDLVVRYRFEGLPADGRLQIQLPSCEDACDVVYCDVTFNPPSV